MGDLLQSEGWERFQRALGRKTERVDGVLCIRMPLPFGLSYWYSPRGILSVRHCEEPRGIGDSRHPTGRRGNPGAIFWRGELGDEFRDLNFQLSTPRILRHSLEPEWTWRTNLEGTDEELLLRMHEKHRYNVRLAEKRGVIVRAVSRQPQVTSEDFASCWALLQETARRQGIQTHPRTYYEAMVRVVPRTSVYRAERDGGAITTAIVAYCGDTATYLHGGSSYEYRAHMAPHLLHWHAMRDARDAGMRWYEWGGISPPRAGISNLKFQISNSDWSGITRFKMGFGGEAVHHPPTRDLVFRPGWYRMLSLLARLRG